MGAPEPKHTLTAIVFADVVGYSRMMGTDDAATVALLRKRRAEVIEPLVAAFRGRIVNAAGDSVLMEFASVVGATRFALSMQQTNAKLNAEAQGGKPLQFRVGVHLGDVLVGRSAVYGDSVNVAARLESLAEPGGVCLSAAAHEQVRGKIDAAFVDRGLQQVKNIAQPVGVFSLAPDAIAAAPQYAPSGRRWRRPQAFAAAALVALALAAAAGFQQWRKVQARAALVGELDHALAATQARLGADARTKLVADYLGGRPHRAFAVAPVAQNHWWTGDWPSADIAVEKVLERCDMAFGEACSLTAIDEDLANSAMKRSSIAPRVGYQGRFDPAQIPAVRLITLQRKDVADYGSAQGPKAIAIHPRGVLTLAVSATSQRRAEIQALKACNDDELSRDADGPCFLYAAGDDVVLPRRATAAITPKL